MFFRPTVLTLVTTHRCNAACDNCCFSCGPKVADAIPIERMHALIDEARDFPSIREVAFTGGECFLLGDDLDALVRRASDYGWLTRAITNGYWGKDPETARRRARRIREAGLTEIIFSTGEQHQRFVNVDRVAYGARAAHEAGIATRIAVETYDGSSVTPDAVAAHEAIRDAVRLGAIDVFANPWIANAKGDGEASPTHVSTGAGKNDVGGRCRSILDTATITPRLQLVACCGYPFEELPELWLGSVATRSLREIVDEADDNLLMMWLHVEGPRKILEFVRGYEPSLEIAETDVTICQACYALHRNPIVTSVLRAHIGEVERRVVSAYLALQLQKRFLHQSP